MVKGVRIIPNNLVVNIFGCVLAGASFADVD